MPPLRKRGGMRGRGRSMAKRRGPKSHQLSSSVTADDSNVDGIESFERVINHQSQSKSLARKKQRKYNEERELSLPRLKPTIIPDNSILLKILSQPNDTDYIMTDGKLDHLQWELESILTSIIIRRNTIQDELNTLTSMQLVHSLPKISKNQRFKAAAEISPINEIKFKYDPNCKQLPSNKSESSSNFWSTVKPYLAHVSKEDLKWLNDFVKSYDSTEKLYEIPPLGEHYAKKWATKELEIQNNQSSSSPRSLKGLPERISPDIVEILNKLNSSTHDGNGYTSLYREVVMNLTEHLSLENLKEYFDIEDKPQKMSNVCKEFYKEQSVEKQLFKLGLMDHHSEPVPSPNDQTPAFVKSDEDCDEILEELNKCNNELAQLQEMNKNHLADIYGRCLRDYCQQKIKTKISNVDSKILNLNRQHSESWIKEKKIAQLSEEDKELKFLLHQRNHLLLQMQSVMFAPSSSLSQFLSDDSESSDEESDQPKKNIQTEMPAHDDTSEKQDDKKENECPPKENVVHNVQINIKQELIDEVMDCEELNQTNEDRTKHNEQNNDGVTINKEMEKHVSEKNIAANAEEDKNFQDCQTKFEVSENINDKVDEQIKIKEDEKNDIVKPIVKECLGNQQKSISENEEASKTLFKIKTTEYGDKLDPSDVSIDGIKQGLQPHKLNNSNIYFEPYDGTSEESDYTDLSD